MDDLLKYDEISKNYFNSLDKDKLIEIILVKNNEIDDQYNKNRRLRNRIKSLISEIDIKDEIIDQIENYILENMLDYSQARKDLLDIINDK